MSNNNLNNINFLDSNFYLTLPIWTYVVTGFGIVNLTFLFCCVCRYRNKISKLKIREFELEKREMEIYRRFEIEKRSKELERRQKENDEKYEGIILTKPKVYSELV